MTLCNVLQLGGEVTAARRARAFVRETVGPHVPEDLLDDLLVVVSELVTNAVMHAGTASELEVRLAPDGSVELRVSDGDTRTPVRRTLVGGLAAQGRGLVLLGALAHEWGIDERTGGKTVWAVLRSATDEQGARKPA